MSDTSSSDKDIQEAAAYRYDDRLPAGSQMLEELLKASEFQQLFASYYRLIKIPVAIIDLDANVLLSSRWQRICTLFHRENPKTRDRCIECDTKVALQIKEGQTSTIYHCLNGLTDCASPIIIDGTHIANVFIGQFLTEAPDEARFRRQAEEFGFDVDDYIAALRELPIVEEKDIPNIIDLLARITRVVTGLSVERKRAQDGHARQSLILDTIPQSVFWKDREGRYLGCNAHFARAAGLASSDDIVGKTDFDLPTPRSEAEAYRADDRAVIATNQPRLHIVEPLRRADGSRIVISTSKVPLRDAGGTTCGIVGIWEDITERRETERRLEISEANLHSLIEGTDDIIVSRDREQRVLVFNEAFASFVRKAFGVAAAAGLRTTDFLSAADRARWDGIHAQVLSGKEVHEEFSWLIDGSTRLYELALKPIRSESGIIGSAEYTRDITERRRIEEQFRQAQKMETVGQLAGGVAHDFNNMLQVISSNAELALSKIDAGQPQHKYLLEIRRAAQRSAEITGQLLAFARRQTVSPKVLDLNDAVARSQKMLQRLIGEDIELAWIPGHDLWKVEIDPSQLDQVLANLAVNARDAIGGVGRLTVETHNITLDEAYGATHAGVVPGEYLLLALSDDGCGMSKETLSHLFEPFFTTKEVRKGTGLGLATVYGIVKQNKGFINVYSEPGEGTTFRVYLPRAEGAEGDEGDEGEDVEAVVQRGGSETVLVVEDEEAILELARENLKELGYTVLSASSPEEALRMSAAHAGKIDLLVTDVVMPRMNGRQLAERIGGERAGLKVLYMSGYTADVIAHRGVLEQGVSLIAKPFSLTTLADKVREVLDG